MIRSSHRRPHRQRVVTLMGSPIRECVCTTPTESARAALSDDEAAVPETSGKMHA